MTYLAARLPPGGSSPLLYLCPSWEDLTMSITDRLTGPARRFLAARLGQLAHRLEDLGRRLREGIAHAVSQVVAEGVHEAVRSALDSRPPPDPPPRTPHPWQDDEALETPDDLGRLADLDGFGWGPAPS